MPTVDVTATTALSAVHQMHHPNRYIDEEGTDIASQLSICINTSVFTAGTPAVTCLQLQVLGPVRKPPVVSSSVPLQ